MKVAIAGFGSIGKELARRLTAGEVPGFELAAIGVRDPDATFKAAAGALPSDVRVVPSVELHRHAAIILECVPTAAFRAVVEPALRAGCTIITVSGAALLDHADLLDVARAHDGHLVLATGAIGGLDALKALRRGAVHSVTMVTRKPPKSLTTAKQVVECGIDLFGSPEPIRLFGGTAREAARAFPANVNVAAAVALAGIGPERTTVEIWSDPGVDRNTHIVTADGELARFTFRIENVPSEDNPGTGRITAPSMLAALAELAGPMRVGT